MDKSEDRCKTDTNMRNGTSGDYRSMMMEIRRTSKVKTVNRLSRKFKKILEGVRNEDVADNTSVLNSVFIYTEAPFKTLTMIDAM